MMNPKERASRASDAMWNQDGVSQWLGLQLVEVDEGVAKVSLVVQEHHANGLGICYGGITYSLADSAFTLACNSRNQATVAQHNSISYIASAKVGNELTATATEASLVGRNGIADVTVKNQKTTCPCITIR